MYIDCFWVSGSFKGHGYSNDLLNACIDDAKAKGKKGLCILSSAKKRPFLSDPKHLAYKGFMVADESAVGINLMYLPFDEQAAAPCFKPVSYIQPTLANNKKGEVFGVAGHITKKNKKEELR